MGEGEEDPSSNTQSSTSRARNPPRSQPKDDANRPPRRARPQRQKKREAAAQAAQNGSTATGPALDPSAPDFVPRQSASVPVALNSALKSSSAPAGGRNAESRQRRPYGGRRGNKNQKEMDGKEKESGEETTTQNGRAGPSQRREKTSNARTRVQPKIIKESEDLMLRMTEALTKNEYDCSICTDTVCPFYPMYL